MLHGSFRDICNRNAEKKIQELQQQVNNTRVAAASEQGELM
jgi:hypothetical protein